MSTIKLSRDAALKAKKYTQEAFLDLEANTKVLSERIDTLLLNLNDKPTTKKYDEMMLEIQSILSQLRGNFNDIDEFCDEMIRWIDEYNSH